MPGFRSPYVLGGRTVCMSRRPAMMSPPGYNRRFVRSGTSPPASTLFGGMDGGGPCEEAVGSRAGGGASEWPQPGVEGGEGCTHRTSPPPSHRQLRHHPQAVSFGWRLRMKGRSGEETRTACGVKNREMTENSNLQGCPKRQSQEEALKTRSLCLGFSTSSAFRYRPASQGLSE